MVTPLISIVIPVYNVKDYLVRCLESILAIDYDNKEIVVVDDGSTDGSERICDDYAKSFHEVQVIHHDCNKGLVNARITGLNSSSGEYLMFVDSDDCVHQSILRLMIGALDKYDADIACCSYYICELDGTLQQDKRSIYGFFDRQGIERIASDNLLFDKSLNKSGLFVNWWGKLFKKTLLDGSIQKSIGLYVIEDIVPVMDIIVNKCQKLVVIDEPLYYYVQHPSQLTRKSLLYLCPEFIKVWERLDDVGGRYWKEQLARRMFFRIIIPYYSGTGSGHRFTNKEFIASLHILRRAEIVKKYLWNNNLVPEDIKKNPHFMLLKLRLFRVDYLLYHSSRLLKKCLKRVR